MAFFSSNQVQSASRPDGKTYSCVSCGLYKDVLSPRMQPFGNFRKGILNLGEAPGCVAGNTLVDVAYRDKSIYPHGIPIKELVGQSGFLVYSFDIEQKKIVLGKVKRAWKTGIKKTFKVTYEWFGFSNGEHRKRYIDFIVVTHSHPFLLRKCRGWKDPFKGIEEEKNYLSIDGGLRAGHSLQPFIRYFPGNHTYIATAGGESRIEAQFLVEHKMGRRQKPGHEENTHHIDGNPLNDSWDNLICLPVQEHARVHATTNNPMHNPIHRRKHKEVMQSTSYRKNMSEKLKAYLVVPENYEKRLRSIQQQKERTSQTVKDKFRNDPIYYYNYLLGRQKYHHSWTDDDTKDHFSSRFPEITFPPVSNHKIIAIEEAEEQEVYDLEVETYHNFAAHGIFVHNSEEDKKGKQWQGKAGQLLQRTYKKLGIDLFEDCLNINSINCRPVDKKGNNRAPTNYEIACCRPRVLRLIEKVKPKCIILHGNIAIQSLIGHRWKKDLGGIFKWRGWTIPDRDFQAWICPVFHSSYVMRQEESTVAKVIWEKDLEKAFSMVGTSFPKYENEENQIEIINSIKDQVGLLRKLNMGSLHPDPQELAFDIETTGLKPQDTKVHKVGCTAFCDNSNQAYVITGPKATATNQAFRDLLTNPNIGKIAANMKFEDTWMHVLYGLTVTPWVWDTMQAAHVLDNRPGITGLKFQTYVNFGVVDYDSDVAPFLRGPAKDANAPNQLDKVLKDPELFRKLKIYCGMDALFTYRLAQIQKQQMEGIE